MRPLKVAIVPLLFMAMPACAVDGFDASVAQDVDARAVNSTDTGGSPAAGGSGSGGASDNGGATANGGMPANAAGGAPPDAGETDPCSGGKKLCGGLCVARSPALGCGPRNCDPCPAPENGVATCDGDVCSFACNDGFLPTADGTACEPAPIGSGGSPGAGGAIGAGGSSACVASQCGSCLLLRPECCLNGGTACGCRDLIGNCLPPL